MRLAFAFGVFFTASARAQFGADGPGGMPKKPKPSPLNDDLPFIKCPVCEKMAAEAHKRISEIVEAAPAAKSSKRRFETSSHTGDVTAQVESLLENICDADADGKEGRTKDGRWLAEYDIAKDGQTLTLKHMGPGHCRRECRTIAKSCETVLAKLSDGDDDLSEVLLKAVREKQSVGMVAQRMCTKLAGVCKKKKTPLWPEGKPRKNEQFKAKDKKDTDLEDLLASMGGMGGGMGGLTSMSASDMDLDGVDTPVDEIDIIKDEL